MTKVVGYFLRLFVASPLSTDICQKGIKVGTGDAISPASHDANGATFSDLTVAAGHNLVAYRGGMAWFTVTAQASGDDGNE